MKVNSSNKKKLIEVALPLEVLNRESSREKSIRHGHPSTMHIWWARRPLAACRAVLFASLVDDPGNDLPEKEAQKKRNELFRLMEKFIKWKNTKNDKILKEVRREIKNSIGDKLPVLVDPFCGGGSIPLEAQRLGLQVYASDLNPVATLITKALIEIPAKFRNKGPINPNSLSNNIGSKSKGADGLAADVENYGKWMSEEADKKIGSLYPTIKNFKVVAWIWCKTVQCPNPACKAIAPLARTFKLSQKKSGGQFSIHPIVNKKIVSFEVKYGKNKIEPGTVNKSGPHCLICNLPITFDHIRKEGKKGTLGKKLMAIVAQGDKTFTFYSPTDHQIEIAEQAKPKWTPETELPIRALGFRVQQYGMTKHKDLFTARQLVALSTFSDLVLKVHKKIIDDAIRVGFVDDSKGLEDQGTGAKAYADAIITYLSLAVGRSANYWSAFTPWGGSHIVGTFGRQALPMVWDFAEANPFSNRTGNWLGAIHWITQCLRDAVPARGYAEVMQLDCTKTIISKPNLIVCTDPPYYDNIGYADLSDYFYTWLRHSLKNIYPNLFSTVLTPKVSELIASPFRFEGDKNKAEEFFLNGLKKVFKLIYKKCNDEFPISFFYAFKQQEQEVDIEGTSTFVSTGWETMLEALISSGFQITGTWPIRTERTVGWKGLVNALASSIVLVCRKRSQDAGIITRREFLLLLRKELPKALITLHYGNIAPVDLAQSTIGPAMAIFSRYSKILEADGTKMNIRTALQIINQELDSFLTASESEFDQVTRFCLSWFEQYGNQKGAFGDADVLARAKNTSVNTLEQLKLIESGAGKVKLLDYKELNEDMDPSEMDPIIIWMVTHLMIKKLETKGEDEVGKLIQKIGSGTSERAKELAYRLYSICDKKKWADKAFSYNNLVSSWTSIQDGIGLATVPEGQTRL